MKHKSNSKVISKIYHFTKEVYDDTTQEVSITGDNYQEINNYGLEITKIFIERDIYLAIKDKKLPYFEYNVIANHDKNLIIISISKVQASNEFYERKFVDALLHKKDEYLEAIRNQKYFKSIGYVNDIKLKIAQIAKSYVKEKYSVADGNISLVENSFNYLIRQDKCLTA